MDAIVLVGHGKLPEAMRSSVEMIVGERDDIWTVCLEAGDGKEDLARKFDEVDEGIANADSVRIFADIMGGSPCNTALERYHDDARVSIVSGMNLAMIVSAAIEGAGAEAVVVTGHEGIHDVKALAAGTERPYGAQKPVARPVTEAPSSNEPHQVVGVRVDARGIHGQVATAWVPHLNANRILVIDDAAIHDETQKMALKMAKPASAKLSILSCKKAVERLRDELSYPGERIFVVMPRVKTLGTLHELGYTFDKVNMGNVPDRPGASQYAKCVRLTDEEAEIVRMLADEGTVFTARQVPADPEDDFAAAVRR